MPKNYRISSPVEDAKGVVLIVHGLGEHIHRYDEEIDFLNKAGLSVYGFDHIGHGYSAGLRGHISAWSDYRDGLASTYAWVQEQEPHLPIHIWGHSLGTLITLEWVLATDSSPASLILSGPIVIQRVPIHKYIAAVFLGQFWPRLMIETPVELKGISSIKAERERYQQDANVTSYVTTRMGRETIKAIDKVQDGLANVDLPMLIGHGEDDYINPPFNSEALSSIVASQDLKTIYYEGCRHEIHHDTCREEWLNEMVDWVLARSAPISSADSAEEDSADSQD